MSNGVEAIEVYQNGNFDLVLLDMMMEPGISGLETTKQLIKINPEVKILIVSGYSETGMIGESIALGAKGFIQKPYTIKTIGLKLQEVFNETN